MQTLIKIYNFLSFMLLERWYYYLLIFIIILATDRLLRIYSNNILGWLAERSVARVLSKLDPKKYKVINNIMVKANGSTAQIDHLIISNYGIFVIETKNYYGWISGNEYGNWLQTIYKIKRKMINPISQNFMHMKALQNLLENYPIMPYYSVVVFTKRSILKVITKTDVVYYSDLLATIKKYRTEFISDGLMEKVFQDLTNKNIRARRIRKEHVNRIKDNKKNSKSKINNNICPKCGGLLIIRDGKYGKFKGCKNFPECRFSASI